MPVVVAALLVILLAILGAAVVLPLALLQRYRAGTARRRARPWLAGLNAAGLAVSSVLFLTSAALANIWIPHAFAAAAAGLAAGVVLGLAGLLVTRWEAGHDAVYYTPNRWLVLALTLTIAARLAVGVWRASRAWGTSPDTSAWLTESGAAGSLAAGAIIIGYYLAYWLGVRRRALRAA